MFNKLFIKKPLWVLGLAAAAIFAVTFVACGGDDSPSAANYPVSEGQAVLFYSVDADPTDPEDTFVGASLAQNSGAIVTFGTPAAGEGLFKLVTKDTVLVGSDGKLFAGSEGDVYAYCELTTTYTEIGSLTVTWVGAGEGGLLASGKTPGTRYLCIPMGSGFVPAGAATIAGTFVEANLAYEVEVITLGASGSKHTRYFPVAAGGATLTATGLDATNHRIKIVGPVSGFVAAGAGVVNGTFENTTTNAFECEVITLGNAGGKATRYFFVASTTTLTATGLAAATHLTKVASTPVNSAGFAPAGSAVINGTGFGSTTTVVYEAEVITVGNAGNKRPNISMWLPTQRLQQPILRRRLT